MRGSYQCSLIGTHQQAPQSPHERRGASRRRLRPDEATSSSRSITITLYIGLPPGLCQGATSGTGKQGSHIIVARLIFRLPLLLVLVALSLAAAHGAVAEVIPLTSDTMRVDLGGKMEMLRDETGTLTIEDMTQPHMAGRFRPLPGELSAGYDKAAYWLRFDLDRDADAATRWFIEVKMPHLDHVGLYAPDGDGGYSVVKTGDRTPFSTRPLAYRTFLFHPLVPEGRHTAYLRIQSNGTITVSATIWSDTAFAESGTQDSLLLGLINGSLGSIIIFSLFQFTLKRETIYLYFGAYICASEVLYLSVAGYVSQYFFPNSPTAVHILAGLALVASVGLWLVFVIKALDLEEDYPRLNKAYRAGAWLMALAACIALFDRVYRIAALAETVLLLSLLSTAAVAALQALKDNPVGRVFLASSVFYILGIGLVLLRILGVANVSSQLNVLALASAVPHMLLLSLGLLHRSARLDASRLEMARRTERYLERRVALRTAELADTNSTLAAEIGVRRLAEDRLRESERQVRAILDAAPFPMVVAGFPSGRFMFLNQPAVEFLNITSEDMETMTTVDFYANPEERGLFLMTLKETGGVLGAELYIRRLPHELRWVLLSAVRFTYRDQDAVLICLNDISTRKRLEESLRVTNIRSEVALEAGHQALREQRNFLSMVSHEFRVPLAIIEAASQLLGIYSAPNSEAQEEVAKISRAVRRMSDLIDICLADDRLDSNMMSLKLAPIELGLLLGEICDDKRPFAANRTMTLSCPDPVSIEADPTLLRIGFSNLIDNALKFSPPNSPVEISLIGDPEGAMIRVTDHGPGISLEEQPRIFEKFFRSTKADRVRGAGLGLYIVRRIVELHGGSIAVDSRPSHGATFIIWLPLKSNARDFDQGGS